MYMLFLKIHECIKWTVILNVDMKRVWIYYNSITVDVLKLFDSMMLTFELTLLRLFFLEMYKIFFTCFFKIVPRYNQS